jgi:hypothetical protein
MKTNRHDHATGAGSEQFCSAGSSLACYGGAGRKAGSSPCVHQAVPAHRLHGSPESSPLPSFSPPFFSQKFHFFVASVASCKIGLSALNRPDCHGLSRVVTGHVTGRLQKNLGKYGVVTMSRVFTPLRHPPPPPGAPASCRRGSRLSGSFGLFRALSGSSDLQPASAPIQPPGHWW